MKRRGLCLVLAAVMAMTAMAGCGGKKSASSGDTFKIGGQGPTTGNAAIYGNAVKNGMELAANEINAAGGINGIACIGDVSAAADVVRVKDIQSSDRSVVVRNAAIGLTRKKGFSAFLVEQVELRESDSFFHNIIPNADHFG